MCAPGVEEEIKKLDPEVSKIYFEAKEALATSQDSRSERFSIAARVVRAFWKRSFSNVASPVLIKSRGATPLQVDAKDQINKCS
jgi:hypothetical protein